MPRKSDIVSVPFHYDPREYQRPFWDAMKSGTKRAALVWHRRAGKDKTALNFLISEAQNHRVGTYYYFFPTYAQGKKIIWDGMDKEGFPFLSHVPPALISGKNETEMQIQLKGGSIIQVIGTDRMDSIVGTNPVGCVFSEYALQNPRAWDLVRPILRENGGWAVFTFTPRGKNHGFRLYQMAKANPDWFCQLLTVDNTHAIALADIEKDRAEGMDEDLVQQEYYCSFTGSVQGSYYSKQMDAAYSDGRITSVPWEPSSLVETWWDIGIGDSTAIWFVQRIGRELRCIDYLEASGEGLSYYIKELKDRPYAYTAHVAPHDMAHREFGTGVTRAETAAKLGLRFRIAPKLGVDEGIDAVRRMFPRLWFDEKKCQRGLDALSNYHKEWNEGRQEFSKVPVHDWSSHAADSLRTGAVGGRESAPPFSQAKADDDYDPFA